MSDLDLSTIRRPVRAVGRRIRLCRALSAGTTTAVGGLGAAGLVVALAKSGTITSADATVWLGAAAALPIVGFLVGLLRPVGRLVPAQRLDRVHDLHSRIASALEFASVPDAERTPFMRAAIEDALRHADRLEPRRAVPIRVPRDLVAAVGLAAGVGVLALLEVPERQPVPVTAQLSPLLLHQDDLDAFSGNLDELVNDPDASEEVRDAARQFNRLVEDLADRRLDRTEALRRISQLERRIAEGRMLDAEALRDTLRRLGDELRRASLTRAASEALRDADAARAERAMRELAQQLRTDPPSRAELERLRQALERAARETRSPEDLQREIERQRERMQRLLQREREKNEMTERERRLLQRRRRELERLERERQEAIERQRRLERLRRELERAAEDLRREMPERAADSLDRGAEDLNRMARQQMSEEQMRQLIEQLRQLRELIRRQRQQAQNGRGGGRRQGGQGRMDRFVLRARGQGGGEGVPLLMPGGQQGQAGQGGRGPRGGNSRGEGQRALVPGGQGGDARLEIPGMGGSPQGTGRGQGGQAGVGPGAGTGHDPRMLDDPTRLDSTRRNVRIEGEQSEGPSRSEVILSAADRGFVSRSYRDVYTDYSRHAEEVLERDEIPPGYRFYVRRYFQLIRPREQSE